MACDVSGGDPTTKFTYNRLLSMGHLASWTLKAVCLRLSEIAWFQRCWWQSLVDARLQYKSEIDVVQRQHSGAEYSGVRMQGLAAGFDHSRVGTHDP